MWEANENSAPQDVKRTFPPAPGPADMGVPAPIKNAPKPLEAAKPPLLMKGNGPRPDKAALGAGVSCSNYNIFPLNT